MVALLHTRQSQTVPSLTIHYDSRADDRRRQSSGPNPLAVSLVTSVELGVPTMLSNAPIIPSSAFSVIALLPDSMSMGSQTGPTPPPLVHRDSAPKIHTRSDWNNEETDNLSLHSRRLSLAPGLGSGFNTASKPSPLATSPEIPSSSRLAPPNADSPSSMHSRTRRSGNRKTSLGSPLGSEALRQPRGSMQIGSAARSSAMAGRSRPGAAGDDLVGALRQYGLEGE